MEYGHFDKPWELEPHYSKHVLAMTKEGLHSKADIASELAYRDKEIESLHAQLAECQKDAGRYRWLREYWTRIVSHMESPFEITFDVRDEHWGTLPPDVIDAAIDTAMKEEK